MTLNEQYACRHLLEIGAQLRNLIQRDELLTVDCANGRFGTRLLEVSHDRFVFEAAAPEVRQVLPGAGRCSFTGVPSGVQVEFEIDSASPIDFNGRPALAAAYPEVLYYVQRRQYFRVDTPREDPFLCCGTLADGTAFRFELFDLSMTGAGIQTDDPAAGRLEVGMLLQGVELRLGTRATLQADLELMSTREPVALPGYRRLGFRFAALPASAEGTLQRLITELAVLPRAVVVPA